MISDPVPLSLSLSLSLSLCLSSLCRGSKPRNRILWREKIYQCYHSFLHYKLLKSSKVNLNINQKSRINLNMFYFTTGDINKNSGPEIEYLLDPSLICKFTCYPSFFDMQKVNPSMKIFSAINITKSYNGAEILHVKLHYSNFILWHSRKK